MSESGEEPLQAPFTHRCITSLPRMIGFPRRHEVADCDQCLPVRPTRKELNASINTPAQYWSSSVMVPTSKLTITLKAVTISATGKSRHGTGGAVATGRS